MKRTAVVLTVLLALAGTSPAARAPEQPPGAQPGAIVSRGEGHRVSFSDGRLMRIKVGPQSTGSSHLVMVDEDMPPGTGIPIHRHNRDEEIVVVHRGVVTVTLGEREAVVQAGTAVHIPRGVWIGVKNTGSEPATVIAVFAHPDMEACFRLLGKIESGEASAEEAVEYKQACEWTVK